MNVTPQMIEQMARNLCALRRLDPEEPVEMTVPDGKGGVQDITVPGWKLFADEITAWLQIQHAIQTGANGVDHLGRPLKPTILGADGLKLN